MRVPLIDLKRHHAALREELTEAFLRVLDSGRYILGPEVEAFEREMAEYLGCRYVVGVANGTDALRIALEALNIGPGDEVITTPFTFIATGEMIAIAGAKPVFADILDDTLNIDPEAVEAAATARTRAVIPVHLYGQGARVEEIQRRLPGIPIIEDTAQGIGAERHGRKLGTFGVLGTFSFFPTKNLSALGDAGMVVTDDPELYEAARILRVHGSIRKYHHVRLGFNSRLDALQAAFLRVKLKHIDRWNQRRREVAARYTEGLKDLVRTPVVDEGNTHIFHQYTIRTEARDQLRAFLRERGVDTAVHYPLPLHLQPAFADLGYREGAFPVAERAAREVLSLPMFPEITDAEVEYVIESVRAFFGR